MDETGTSLYYHPGLLTGGRLEHDCSPERGVGYYAEVLLCLGPFCKRPLEATLRGVTHREGDPSPELLKASALPVLKRSERQIKILGFSLSLSRSLSSTLNHRNMFIAELCRVFKATWEKGGN